MPRPKKKTPLTLSTDLPQQEESSINLEITSEKKQKTTRRPSFLSLDEKRKWLAAIVRDTSGQHQGFEIGMGDKFKALVEDNKLAGHPTSLEEEKNSQKDNSSLPELLRCLLETVTPPQQQRFSTPHE